MMLLVLKYDASISVCLIESLGIVKVKYKQCSSSQAYENKHRQHKHTSFYSLENYDSFFLFLIHTLLRAWTAGEMLLSTLFVAFFPLGSILLHFIGKCQILKLELEQFPNEVAAMISRGTKVEEMCRKDFHIINEDLINNIRKFAHADLNSNIYSFNSETRGYQKKCLRLRSAREKCNSQTNSNNNKAMTDEWLNCYT
uniref:Uncharacterized protein n=1 Tax=Glossina brevipalpis TaxID=37001 RepID=A0A1A9WPY8_9MUSC